MKRPRKGFLGSMLRALSPVGRPQKASGGVGLVLEVTKPFLSVEEPGEVAVLMKGIVRVPWRGPAHPCASPQKPVWFNPRAMAYQHRKPVRGGMLTRWRLVGITGGPEGEVYGLVEI